MYYLKLWNSEKDSKGNFMTMVLAMISWIYLTPKAHATKADIDDGTISNLKNFCSNDTIIDWMAT